MTVTVGLVILGLISCTNANPSRNCPTNLSCTSVSDCRTSFGDNVIYPCSHGKKICCPVWDIHNGSSNAKSNFHSVNSTNVFEGSVEEQWNNPSNRTSNSTFYERSHERIGQERTENYKTTEIVSDFSLSIPNQPVLYTHRQDLIASTSVPRSANIYDNIEVNTWDSGLNLNSPEKNNSKDIKKLKNDQPVIERTMPFKENCGLTFADDKVTGGNVAEIGQFPWMALLAFRHTAQPNPQFLCGGSLITAKHILTAAHCIVENRPFELVFVRLGEYNLSSQRDCVNVGNNRIICADQHLDVPVDQITVHPQYSRKTLKNDIALIRLKYGVRESDYVRPICLPFNKNWSYSDLTYQNFTVSGWGKTQAGNLFGSNVLQYAKVTTWDQHRCNDSIPNEVKPLGDTQLCANGHNSEDACKGDSGGPLMNITLDKNLEVRHIQFGIVSFGTATCGDKNLPTIYTRVDLYLKWILETVS